MTPNNCKVGEDILECTPSIPSDLPNCFIKRSIFIIIINIH